MSLRLSQEWVARIALAACLVGPAPLAAETLSELDALSDATEFETGGITVARNQADRGQYLDALATLERVLAANPKSGEAQLMHAIYLCRIGDRQGGLVEIGKFSKKQFSKQDIADSKAACERVAGEG